MKVRMRAVGSLSRLTALIVILLSGTAISQTGPWVLPVPEGGEPKPSPPSIQGSVFAARKEILVVRIDRQDEKPAGAIPVRITSKTEYFTTSGEPYTPDELREGQYVWIWYTSPDPARAGKPPRAVVVMLWSKNPSDQPPPEIRWKFDKK